MGVVTVQNSPWVYTKLRWTICLMCAWWGLGKEPELTGALTGSIFPLPMETGRKVIASNGSLCMKTLHAMGTHFIF